MALALLSRDRMEDDFERVRLLTLRQTAEVLHVSVRTVLRMLWRNELPGVKVGSHWRICESDLTRFIRSLEEM